MPHSIKKGREYLVNEVAFKRTASYLAEWINTRTCSGDVKTHEIHRILAIAMGYANFHDLQAEAHRAEEEKKNAEYGGNAWLRQASERMFDKIRPLAERVCSPALLSQRDNKWLTYALARFAPSSIWTSLGPQNVLSLTVLVGSHSDMLLEAWSAVKTSTSEVWNITDESVFDQLIEKVEANNEARNEQRRNAKGYGNSWPQMLLCISGFTREGLTQKHIDGLVRLAQADLGQEIVISLNRSDLEKLTSPDLSQSHFERIKLNDLDLIDAGNISISRYVWTDKSYVRL